MIMRRYFRQDHGDNSSASSSSSSSGSDSDRDVAEEAATDDEVEQQEVEQDEAAGEESGEEEEEELEQQIQEEGDCFATLSHRGMGSFAYIFFSIYVGEFRLVSVQADEFIDFNLSC